MKRVRTKVESSFEDGVWTVRVEFENLLWDKGVELFRQAEFVKCYTDFILSFVRGHRVAVQYGHFGIDRQFLDWLADRHIRYVTSNYAFSHLGDWACEMTGGAFEVLFEPPEGALPELIRSHAWSDEVALIAFNGLDVTSLDEISAILSVPGAAGTRSQDLLRVCQWLILTEDDGETVVLKSKQGDSKNIVQNNLAFMEPVSD